MIQSLLFISNGSKFQLKGDFFDFLFDRLIASDTNRLERLKISIVKFKIQKKINKRYKRLESLREGMFTWHKQ